MSVKNSAMTLGSTQITRHSWFTPRYPQQPPALSRDFIGILREYLYSLPVATSSLSANWCPYPSLTHRYLPPVHSRRVATPVHWFWWSCDCTFLDMATWPLGHPSFVLSPCIFPIVLPWYLVHIYIVHCSSYPINQFPSPLLSALSPPQSDLVWSRCNHAVWSLSSVIALFFTFIFRPISQPCHSHTRSLPSLFPCYPVFHLAFIVIDLLFD